MADETVASWTDLLRQFRGPLVEALRWSTPALSEIKRNHNPRRWQGTQVVIPVITAPLQGTGALASEVAVLNEPSVIATEQATIESAILALRSVTGRTTEQHHGNDLVLVGRGFGQGRSRLAEFRAAGDPASGLRTH